MTAEPVTVADAPSLDLGKYRAMMDDEEGSDESAEAFLATLAAIMKGFVDNAWDVGLIPAIFPEIFDDASAHEVSEVDSEYKETTSDEA